MKSLVTIRSQNLTNVHDVGKFTCMNIDELREWAKDHMDPSMPARSEDLAADGRWLIMSKGDADPGIVWSDLFPKED